MFGKKKRIKFNSMNKSSVSTRASRLPEKNDNIRLQLPKKDILYDIDENEENEMSPEEDFKTPISTFPQVCFWYCLSRIGRSFKCINNNFIIINI